jgi:dihydroceramidase
MTNYYWGTPDTTVQFCEKKYDNVYWIAEYDNTFSSLPYLLLGIFLYNTKIKKIGIATIILGFSTAIMHGTLRYYGQWLDECSLLYISFETIRLIKKNTSFYYFPPIILSYFYFKDYYIFFLSIFTFLQVVIVYLITNKKKRKIDKILICAYIITFSIAGVFWIFDQKMCEPENYVSYHAAWHILSCVGMFYGYLSFII